MALPAVDEMRSALVTPYRIAFICTLVVFLGGCPFMGLVYEDDLADKYAVWATDAPENAAVVYKDRDSSGATEVVPAMVFAYGWNKDFIIAKQHPPYPKESHRIDKNTTYWYLIEVARRKVHGPLSEDKFRELRNELRVPSKLAFTRTIQGSL
ncbi:MAG: DUF3997 domain-containing protein [Sedimentisphaerales bacterium]|jgi:hypothetical protein|nr:DUF3997 domain-containing protein [Sedimentisphaerales bacterium]HNY80559.1 DUF3997 domain-containing protein [Sedimentisphaerales bacterium]HOC65328.1 DUF3997 domain-containing protein [Sedimentisphaerales bacterium]HOH66335.1 DUF3997 domain-containing protein [Sedimentisphaerales bacterium]HPY48781.1 DUF3997 domain-containing protein [Sedimentisphaerales bacterium]